VVSERRGRMNEQQFWLAIWNDWFYTAMTASLVVVLLLDAVYAVGYSVKALEKTIKEKE
jgi:hypothetical protein